MKVEIKSTNIVSIPQLKRGAKPIPADENSDLEKQVSDNSACVRNIAVPAREAFEMWCETSFLFF